MSRPPEYENLIKTRSLEEVAPTPGSVPRYLQNAREYLETVKDVDQKRSLQIFTLAYEGYFQLVQAVLEFYGVRTKDAGRNLAIQRVSTDLKLETGEFAFITKAHARRNGTSYASPFPPVSSAEAAALVRVLERYIPEAYKLVNVPYIVRPAPSIVTPPFPDPTSTTVVPRTEEAPRG